MQLFSSNSDYTLFFQNNVLHESVTPAKDTSLILSKRALKALENVEQKLRPNLTQAEQALKNAWSTLGAADDEDNAIQL